MTLLIDHNQAPNTVSRGKLRLHQHGGPSKRHLRRKLAALQRKLTKVSKQNDT